MKRIFVLLALVGSPAFAGDLDDWEAIHAGQQAGLRDRQLDLEYRQEKFERDTNDRLYELQQEQTQQAIIDVEGNY